MNKRLKQFIDYLGLTVRQFEQKIGVSNGLISKQLRQNTTIQSSSLEKIKENFPHLSIDWLLTGVGVMILSDDVFLKAHGETIPLIPFDALAGIPSIDNIGVSFAECEQYAIPEFIARGTGSRCSPSGPASRRRSAPGSGRADRPSERAASAGRRRRTRRRRSGPSWRGRASC